MAIELRQERNQQDTDSDAKTGPRHSASTKRLGENHERSTQYSDKHISEIAACSLYSASSTVFMPDKRRASPMRQKGSGAWQATQY